MPSSWSTRLLQSPSNTGSSGSLASPITHTDARNKPLPKAPSHSFEPAPTLYGQRLSPPSPSPRVTNREHKSAHSRSISQPMPKLFSKKKSVPDYDFDDNNVPLDDDLVPVLTTDSSSTLSRKILGGKKVKGVDQDENVARRCICCDSKVNVPKGLDKFRCLACLTVNDVEAAQKKQSSVVNDVPISITRTNAIIDECIVRYLEARCHARSDRANNTRAAVSETAQRDLYPAITSTPSHPQAAANITRSPDDRADLSARQRHIAAQRAQESPYRNFVPTLSPSVPSRKQVPNDLSSRSPTAPLPKGSSTSLENAPRSAELPSTTNPGRSQDTNYDSAKAIFRQLEDYIVSTFSSRNCLNSSFSTRAYISSNRTRSESQIPVSPMDNKLPDKDVTSPGLFSEFDAKTLLLGDLGENSSWWAGKDDWSGMDKSYRSKKICGASSRAVSSKSPNIDFATLAEWYATVHSLHRNWQDRIALVRLKTSVVSTACLEDPSEIVDIDADLEEARDHAVRALLKVTENVLKKPGPPMRNPEHTRFLLILLANPSICSVKASDSASPRKLDSSYRSRQSPNGPVGKHRDVSVRCLQHTGLLKRIFGLLAHGTDSCHRYLVGWFSRFDEERLARLVELVAAFVNHRISRSTADRSKKGDILDDGGLIPDISGSAMNTSAQLHAALGLSGSVKARPGGNGQDTLWADDWQLRAAAKVMSLLFAANGIWQGSTKLLPHPFSDFTRGRKITSSPGVKEPIQLLPTSHFYNTLLDYRDMIADFRVWETKRDKFAFCQYPLFLSMGTKIKILEYDARRQMETKAREAYFDQVIRQRAIDGQFHLKIRRECLVDDSLRQISAAVGAGQEELKKSLRVHFLGEEGIDAGGLRKEWFLMVIRDIFDPNHGMFVYDDDSHACYFNAHSFETSDQYHLVGALFGLAIYNSTILDIAFPPFVFRKLLAAAPAAPMSAISSVTGVKGQMSYSLADLAEFRPSLAAGLQQLLDFEGDVESTFCQDFVASKEKYGTIVQIPLVPDGERIPVTNANRHEFVDLYVRHLLDTSVAKQFEPFKRGFFTVCAGNALSLFRAEEIELLVRGSAEPLDVGSLRAVAVYENWRDETAPHLPIINPADSVPVVEWFWETFHEATAVAQRKLLAFVTGSDRIPAVGATSLVLRVIAGGDGYGGGGAAEMERFPVARTCFNMLVLWRYPSVAKLQEKLWRAVEESEGFGLK